MPIGRFLLFSILGSIPWNLALVTAGWVLGENYEALYSAIRPFEILIYVVVVLGLAFILIRWARGRGSLPNA
jgi:membrane protein DedA with SNARE-associated domain